MAKPTEIIEGVVTNAGWVRGGVTDTYEFDVTDAAGDTFHMVGNDRLNVYPVEGEDIRVAGRKRGDYYKVTVLRFDDDGYPVIDPQTSMVVQVERI